MADEPLRSQGAARHLVTPRTLLFLERDGRLLLLRGGPGKWFHGRLNGLGGSVEAGEDTLSAARREAIEETGLTPSGLRLVGLAHVRVEPAVLLLVHHGELPAGDLRPTDEGEHVWVDPVEPPDDLLPDLRALLPRVLGASETRAPFSCTLQPSADGSVRVQFQD